MGIYIKGMEMPKENELIEVRIYPNGRVSMVHDMKCEQIATATEVLEPHGRLIDADALIPIMKYTTTDNDIGVFPIRVGFDAIKGVIDEAQTIIKGEIEE